MNLLIDRGFRGAFVRLCCLVSRRADRHCVRAGLPARTASGKSSKLGQAGLDSRVSVALLSVALAFASVEGAAGEEGVTTERILLRAIGGALRAGRRARHRDAPRHRRRLCRGQCRRRHRRPASRPRLPRRPLRARGGDRQYTQALIAEDRVFALIGEVGTPTSAAAEPIARAAGRTVHRALHRGRVPARPGADQCRQCPRLLFRGDRDDRRPAGRPISGSTPHRGPLPGRFLRADRPRRGAAGAGAAGHDARRRRDLFPQHHRGEDGAPRRSAGSNPRRSSSSAPICRAPCSPSGRGSSASMHSIVNISFVGANALAEALGPAGDGVYVTQVVPFPDGDAMPLLAEYRAALAAHDPLAQPGFGSLEGYIAGRLTAGRAPPPRAGADARELPRGARRGRRIRHRRLRAPLRAGRQSRLGPGVPDRDPRRRQHRAGRAPSADERRPETTPQRRSRLGLVGQALPRRSPARWR